MLVMVALSSGCGTYVNTLFIGETGHEGYRIYGGIQNDFEAIDQSAARIAAGNNEKLIKHTPATVPGACLIATVFTLDLPFSLVADTITLPLCVLYTRELEAEKARKAAIKQADE